ncbi:hypothetical protein SLS60_011575 [Paraconiothyrium brasiliense]|uniref:Uncharacterized protein n=1 Tax=Paraconiothyrium brasiliense TaxID=300254 RepID=A0ABR3QIM0_9PLEO
MGDLEKSDPIEPQSEPTSRSLSQQQTPIHTPRSDTAKEETSSTPPSGDDWDSPEDPDNPQNWNLASKIYHVTVPGLFGFAVPVIGGFAAQYKGWRWTQWCILFISLAVFLSAIPMNETYKKAILKRRAKARGIPASPPPSGAAVKSTKYIPRPPEDIHADFPKPVVFFLSLYTAFTFAILFLFFAAIPYVFERPPYAFSVSQTGLVFLAIGLGVLLASMTGLIIDTKLYQVQHRKATAAGHMHAQPEHRLYNAMIGSVGIPVGLFWFAWTADKGVHWAVPVVGAVPFAWGNLCLFVCTASPCLLACADKPAG